ncbi:MAG: DUF1287 domain-containing protein [Nitrospirales bacterium]
MIGSVSYSAEKDASINSLVNAALKRTHETVQYDGSYRVIPYPMGDVPKNIGVCSDVVIRSYRAVGIDLQKLVHEDMLKNFFVYPQHWDLKKPDPNIDHRRVPNLQAFFTRHGSLLSISQLASDYNPGDIVTWMLPGNLPHIGIVTDQRAPMTNRPMIVHNIGQGPRLEDMLFHYTITGHYYYGPSE